MFLRVTAAKGHRYVQLVHNYRDPETRTTRTRVLYSFGREDQLDVAAMQRLVQSVCRVIAAADPSGTGLASLVGSISEFVGSRDLGGVWVLDHIWHELGLAQAVRQALSEVDADPSSGERWLFASVAATALRGQSRDPLAVWVRDQALVPGLAPEEPYPPWSAPGGMRAVLLAGLERHILAALRRLADPGAPLLYVGTASHELAVAEGLPLLFGLVISEDGLAHYGWAEPAARRPVPPLERVKTAYSAYGGAPHGRTLIGYERRLTSVDPVFSRDAHSENLIIVDHLLPAEEGTDEVPLRGSRAQRRTGPPEVRQMTLDAEGGRRRVTIVYNSPLPTGFPDMSARQIATGLGMISAASTAIGGLRPTVAPLRPGADLSELVRLHGLLLWLALLVTQRAATLAGMDWPAVAAIAAGLKAGIHKTAAGTLWQSSTPAAVLLDLLQSLGADAPPRFLKVLPNP